MAARVWIAALDGACAADCGEDIKEGDEYVDDEDGQAWHLRCAEDGGITIDYE